MKWQNKINYSKYELIMMVKEPSLMIFSKLINFIPENKCFN